MKHIVIDGLNLIGSDLKERIKECIKKNNYQHCYKCESRAIVKSYITFLKSVFKKIKVHLVFKNPYKFIDFGELLKDLGAVYIINSNNKSHKGYDDAYALVLAQTNKYLLLSNDKYRDYESFGKIGKYNVTIYDKNVTSFEIDFSRFIFNKPKPYKFNLEPNF